jgi:hypothetical protein
MPVSLWRVFALGPVCRTCLKNCISALVPVRRLACPGFEGKMRTKVKRNAGLLKMKYCFIIVI